MDKDSISALAILIQAGIPSMLLSPPGRAKTSLVNAIGRKLGIPVVTFLLSWREPSDIAGFPFKGEESVEYMPAPEISRLSKVKKGVLFLDELTTAAPLMQKIALRLIHERVAGLVQLPEGISMVAAGNPPEMAADGYDLAAPLANRMIFLRWAIDLKQWGDYMMTGNPNTLPEIPILPVTWTQNIPLWRSRVLGFLHRRQELIENIPSDPVQAGLAFPTPRSWDMLARACAAAESVNSNESVIQMICSGAVGDGAGFEFLNWSRVIDLPDPEDLLRNPEKFKTPSDSSITYVVMASLVSALNSKPTNRRWTALWRIIDTIVAGKQKDIPAVFMTNLRTLRNTHNWDIPESIREFRSLLAADE